MKFGNFGTGRSYTYRSTRPAGSGKCERIHWLMCFIITLIPLTIYFIYVEYTTRTELQNLQIISKDYQQLIPGQAGIDQIENYNSYEGKTVHLNGIQVKPRSNIQDDQFYIATDAATLKRNVNYCQWVEYRHETSVKVGSNNGTDIYETRVTYSYSLEWTKTQINSLWFDSAISYNNPSRETIPEQTIYAEAALGNPQSSQIYVDGSFMKTQNEYQIPLTMQTDISPYAQALGFDRTDGRYIYSPYKESPLYSGAKKVAGFFMEGVIDIGIQGMCTPGDIRVSWYVSKFEPQQSVMGQLQNGRLIPIKNTGMILSGVGAMTGEQLIEFYEEQAKYFRMWIRLLELTFITIACILGYYEYEDKNKQKVKGKGQFNEGIYEQAKNKEGSPLIKPEQSYQNVNIDEQMQKAKAKEL